MHFLGEAGEEHALSMKDGDSGNRAGRYPKTSSRAAEIGSRPVLFSLRKFGCILAYLRSGCHKLELWLTCPNDFIELESDTNAQPTLLINTDELAQKLQFSPPNNSLVAYIFRMKPVSRAILESSAVQISERVMRGLNTMQSRACQKYKTPTHPA